MTSWVKKIVLECVALSFASLAIAQNDLLEYGLKMGWGQLKIVMQAQKLDSFKNTPNLPDSVKTKIEWIEDIKQFTIDSLGFSPTRNYTKIYDQKGKPLLWVLTASKPFELTPKVWQFPVVGSVTYKGFFSEQEATFEEEILKKEGWDTRIRTVNAWSTLGWFNDPILSGLLEEPEGEIANVIIHELSHGTIFVKNDVEFSENLANFIGEQGSYLYLQAKYGENSAPFLEYKTANDDYRLLASYFVKSAARLDSLYADLNFVQAELAEKINLKNRVIRDIMQQLKWQPFNNPTRYAFFWERETIPNNAFFIIFRQYNNQQDQFYKEFETLAGGNLKRYVAILKARFPA